jgi:hypothetical protein
MTKDEHAEMLTHRAGDMAGIALVTNDMAMFNRYLAISLRLIRYRINLLKRERANWL